MGLRFVLAALALVVPVSGAAAAPQMLGLVATDAPTPLRCLNGVCVAEFSAFCLQRWRAIPAAGAAYAAVDPGSITLVARLADGSEARRPVGGAARISVARGHFAVTISVPENLLEELGAAAAAISVGAMATLVPMPLAGDPDPLSDEEIASAAGPLWSAAAVAFGGGDPNAAAARITNRLINALSGDDADPAVRERLWRDTLGQDYDTRSSVPGVAGASEYFHMCKGMASQGGYFRRCLEHAHDWFIGHVNGRYWTLVGAGV